MPSQNGHTTPDPAASKVTALTSEFTRSDSHLDVCGAEGSDGAGASRRTLYEVCPVRQYPFLVPPCKEKGSTDYRSSDGLLYLRAEAPAGAIYGLPTTDDAGILMYIGTELRDLLKKDPACREVTFTRIDLLRGISRAGASPGGNEYKDFDAGLERLSKTKITTNIGPDGRSSEEATFSFLTFRKVEGLRFTVEISEWFAAAVAMNNLVPVPEHYHSLAKGHERWICRLIWKNLAQLNSVIFSVDLLKKKSGSGTRTSLFNNQMKNIVDRNRCVGYEMTWMADPVKGKHRVQVSVVDVTETLSEAA